MNRPVEVTVVSGKGGTGKTVLVSSLARLLENKVLADCDVDAPDLHLLLKPVVVHREAFSGGKIAAIDYEKCSNCGECARLCRFGAIRKTLEPEAERYVIDPVSCEGCAVCRYACPGNAVEMLAKQNGKWYISETAFGPFVHACLDPAEENSGKLVSVVRKEARDIANRDGLQYIVIDGPPGIGCPVISSIAGVDLVVIVTEPTVSGLYDCERVASLARHFGIAAAAVINKYDLNMEATNEAEAFFERENIMLLGKVPFGLEVSRAITGGTLVVDRANSPVARELRKVGHALRNALEGIGSGAGASK
jgi:MinD superfamily P-loop ATPase